MGRGFETLTAYTGAGGQRTGEVAEPRSGNLWQSEVYGFDMDLLRAECSPPAPTPTAVLAGVETRLIATS